MKSNATITSQISLEDLIAKSGDSLLLKCSYESGTLFLVTENDEFDSDVLIQIKTDSVKFNLKTENNALTRTCRLEITDLAKVLAVKNGFYVSATDFGKFMTETRNGLHLAYGKKANETRFIFSVIGYEPLIICTLNSINDIMFQIQS